MAETRKDTNKASGNTTAAAGGLAALSLAGGTINLAHGASSGAIKIGLIGCGGRGTGAVGDSMKADPGIEVIAVCDAFTWRAEKAAKSFKNKYKDRCKIDKDHIFAGYEAYKEIVKTDADIILMATPPGFRPFHLRACIEAGKNVFMEKPVAVDPVGARSVIESAKMADEKGLNITCGTQRRHEPARQALTAEIHAGKLGELVGGQCYWNGGGIWYRGPKEGMTEMDWQCHNWYHWVWLCGDQICEQHIHNIDILNWCFGGPPKSFYAVGGRQCRDYSKQAKQASKALNDGDESKWKDYEGNIWDHIGTELEYPNGARCLSMGRHAPKSSNRVSEHIVGSKGVSDCRNRLVDHDGKELWKFTGKNHNGRTEEHAVMIRALRGKGERVNEGKRIAESTLTAIGGRMSAYTGRHFSWEWLLQKSKLSLVPDTVESGKGLFRPVPTGHDELV